MDMRFAPWLLLVALATGLTACGGAPRAQPPERWSAAIGADHPLTGRIWSTRAEDFIEPDTLMEETREARYVLIGERHDHPDHHRLQAWVLEGLLSDGGHRAVALEMLDADDAPALSGLSEGADAEALAEAVRWEKSGWPAFELYAPIFEAALEGEVRATVLPGNPARDRLKGVMMQGFEVLPEEMRRRLALDTPLPEEMRFEMAREIVSAHCGHASGGLVPAMARGQRLKDATMAEALVTAGGGAVLITGNGHARVDRGVPWYLRARQAGRSVSIGLIQVTEGESDPADYQGMPFDYVWFTPRLDDDDPCEKFKKSLEKMKAAHGGRLPPARPPASQPSGGTPKTQPGR